jgi:hypothetical protein
LKNGDLAAVDNQFSGEALIEIFYSQVDQASLLGKKYGNGYTDEQYQGNEGDQYKAEKSFHPIETLF